MATVANNAQVSALYAAVFGRAPDKAGLDFWTAQLDGGATLATTAAGFVGHPVFTQTYGSLTNIQFVNQVYQNVLGSSGDSKGVQFWVNKLANEGYSKAQFIAEFVQGALTIDLAAQLAAGALTQAEYDAAVTRQNTLTNKADVGVSFANTFGASSNLSASTDASSANVVNDAAYKAGAAAIAGVTADASTATAAKNAIADAVKTANPVASLSSNLANAATGVKLSAYQAAVKAENDLKASIAKTAADASTTTFANNTDVKAILATVDTSGEVNATSLKAAVDNAQKANLSAQQDVISKQAALDTARVTKSDADVTKAASAANAEVTAVSSIAVDSAKAQAKTIAGLDNTGGTYTVKFATTGAASADEASALNAVAKALGLTSSFAAGAKEADVQAILTSTVLGNLGKDVAYGIALAEKANADKALAADVTANGTTAKVAGDVSALLTKLVATSGSNYYTGTDGKGTIADSLAKAAVDAQTAFKASATDANAYALVKAFGAASVTGVDSSTTAQFNSLQTIADQRVTVKDTADKEAGELKTLGESANAPTGLKDQADRTKAIDAVTNAQKSVTDTKALSDTLTKAQSDFTAADKLAVDTKAALGTDVTVNTVTSAQSTDINGLNGKGDIYVYSVDSAAAKFGKAFSLSLDNNIDKLFIGNGYVQGADITKGNNSALEFFVKNDVNGNAVVSIENSAFGSSASVQEVVNITLTGHSAADVHFASGFITTSAPATA